MKSLSCILFAVFALVIAPSVATADQFACDQAISTYNAMLVDHSEAFKRYSDCLNNSRGKDTCSHEFDVLTNSQHWFQMDVNGVKDWCDLYP